MTYPQVHPQYRHLEADMFDWAERHWAGDKACIQTMVYDHDTERQVLLMQRGYQNRGAIEYVRIYDLAQPNPEAILQPGFRIVPLAKHCNTAERIALENSIWNAKLDEAWFRGKSSAPSYSLDWDLVGVSPQGRQVAACLV